LRETIVEKLRKTIFDKERKTKRFTLERVICGKDEFSLKRRRSQFKEAGWIDKPSTVPPRRASLAAP